MEIGQAEQPKHDKNNQDYTHNIINSPFQDPLFHMTSATCITIQANAYEQHLNK